MQENAEIAFLLLEVTAKSLDLGQKTLQPSMLFADHRLGSSEPLIRQLELARQGDSLAPTGGAGHETKRRGPGGSVEFHRRRYGASDLRGRRGDSHEMSGDDRERSPIDQALEKRDR